MRVKDKHIKEFGLNLISRYAPPPEQKEIKEPLFGIQGELDFSLMLGEPVYNNRRVQYIVKTYEQDPEWFRLLKTRLENWYMDGRVHRIYDDYDGYYYFEGKCTSVDLGVDDATGEALYTISFDCYPFRKAIYPEGNDIWDIFNFYLDYAQPVKYTISGSKTITLMNSGSTSVAPKIISDANMTVTKGNQSLTITPGENKNDDFRLMKGSNTLTIQGNGQVEFEFYKELI